VGLPNALRLVLWRRRHDNGTNGALDLGNGVVAIVGFHDLNSGVNAPDIPLKNRYQTIDLAAATSGESAISFW